MSCEYPCHICDPEAWAEETKPPPYDFDAAFTRASAGLEVAFAGRGRAPIWWKPMGGWPADITISEERDIEDVPGMYAARPSSMKMLMDHRIYLERARNDGVERFKIISFMENVVDWEKGISYLSGVLSMEPPPWGWWMPALNPA